MGTGTTGSGAGAGTTGTGTSDAKEAPFLLIAAGAPLVAFGDPGGTITAVQVFEVTGEGARDVIVGMSGNNSGVGAVYFTISPRLSLGATTVSLTGDQGIATSAPVPVSNISTIPITWRTASDRPWLSAPEAHP